MGKADPGTGSRGLGRLYCDLLGRVTNLKRAAAARLDRISVTSLAWAQSPAVRQQPTRRPPRPKLPEEIQDSIDVQNAIRGTLPAARTTPSQRPRMPPGGFAPSSGMVPPVTHPSMAPIPNNISAGMVESSQARITDRQRSMNALDVEIQKKFALAVACIVFVLLGAPIALRFPRGGVGLVIGVSLSVFALYYVCLIAGETLADKDIASPFWSMWGANVLFSAVGLVLLARMGRESSTSRGGDMSELLDTLRIALARLGRRVGLGADRRRRVA
jgi:lipopolysaccharide export system permease protein